MSDGEQRQWRRRRASAMAHGGQAGLGVAGRPAVSAGPFAAVSARVSTGPQGVDAFGLPQNPRPPASNTARTTPSQAAARQQLLLSRRRGRGGDSQPAQKHPARNWNK